MQLFPAAAYAKNGADIRLAVDAVEDMFRLPDLTHVVIVAGDSDYVPLAQRCKRLGRFVVGRRGRGLHREVPRGRVRPVRLVRLASRRRGPRDGEELTDAAPPSRAKRTKKTAPDPSGELLSRALVLEHERTDEDWVHLSAVKNLLKRMDPSFTEKGLGHKSFSDFVKAHPTVAELDESTNIVRVRLVGR